MQALRSNKRIDGLYLYINTSSADVLAARQKQRLCEDASTLTKRITWAKQQVAKGSAPGLFDAVIPNTSLTDVSVPPWHQYAW
jgi:guanylate kinase